MKLTARDFGLFGLIIYFTFIGGTFYSQLNFPLRVASQIIVTLILGLWLLVKLRRKEGLPATDLDWPIAAYLLVNLVSALLGVSPRYSLETSWFSLAHVLTLYLLVDLIRRGWGFKLAWAFYMTAAVVCLVGLAEFLAWYVGTAQLAGFSQGWLDIGGWRQPIPPQIYRLNITLNGSTPLSAYLALLITPAIGLILTLPRRDQNRQALILWLALALLVQILTFSRAGILALAVSLLLLAAGWLKVTGRGWAELRRYWSRMSPLYRGLIGFGLVLLAGLGLFWLQHSFLNRAGSTNFRLTLWQAAVEIFQDHWLTGAGPANFGRALLQLNRADLPRQQIATAHSIYLNTAAELGVLGLVVGAWLMAALILAWRRRWQQARQGGQAEQIRLVAAGAALVGLAAQTLVDTYTATPNMLVMLALVAYIISGVSPVTTPARRRVAAYLALALLCLSAIGLGWLARADLHFQRSVRAERAGDLPRAIAEATQAHQFDPALTLYDFRLALLQARLADLTGSAEARQAAIDHYQAGLAREPIWGLNSASLAGLLGQQGQPEEAIDIWQRTLAAEDAALYWLNLGYLSEQQGDWANAVANYGQALRRAPGLAASSFWQATPARSARWSDFVEAAVAQLPAEGQGEIELRVDLAMARADLETVEALIGPATPATIPELRLKLAELYLHRGQPEQAELLLQADPITGQDYLLAGWLKLQLGHKAEAERLLKTAVFLGHGAANYYLGQLYEQQGNLPAAEMAYRRGFSPRGVAEDVAVTIYGRPGGLDLAPQVLRVGVGPQQAESWLALARLLEVQQRFAEAQQIYQLLLTEDPFLDVARQRLESIGELDQNRIN